MNHVRKESLLCVQEYILAVIEPSDSVVRAYFTNAGLIADERYTATFIGASADRRQLGSSQFKSSQ